MPAQTRPADADIVPIWVADAPMGQAIAPVARVLGSMPSLFESTPAGFVLRDRNADPAERSRLLQSAAESLKATGLVPGWRDERCALLDARGEEIARFERGAFRTLGMQNRAVHVNGILPDGRLWIARRSPLKPSSPNKLDNLAAGAIAAGESPAESAIRELWEEAGVPAEIAALLTFAPGTIRSLRPLRHGVHDELLLCADLQLPDRFTPVCQDGEVSEFLCMTEAEVQAALATGEFSVEAGLVVADWLQRTLREPLVLR